MLLFYFFLLAMAENHGVFAATIIEHIWHLEHYFNIPRSFEGPYVLNGDKPHSYSGDLKCRHPAGPGQHEI